MPTGVVAVRPTRGTVVIALLATVQAVAALVWATQWVQMGGDVMGRGVLFMPLMAITLFARSGFALVMAALYLLFVWAALTGRRSAWRLGMLAVVFNGFGVLVLVAAGAPLREIALRAIVAVVVLGYLVAPAGRRALRHQPSAR